MRRVGLGLVLALLACQATPGAGDLCARASDCAPPLVCARARCRAGCVRSSDCPALARCLVDPTSGIGTCSLDVDSCSTHACPRGFLCRDDQCLNACGAIVACPDGVCLDGACVPVRGDAGIVPSDGGVSGPPMVMDIAGGNTHFCAVGVDRASGESGLWCWGASDFMALGDRQLAHGTCAACAPRPVRALADASGTPLTNVTAVAAGAQIDPNFAFDAYTCAVVGGQVRCWGSIAYASGLVTLLDPQTVLDTTTSMPLADVRSIVGAPQHACARVGDANDVWCWGLGTFGRLGAGDQNDAMSAVRATQIPSTAVAIEASWFHTLALLSDGSMLGVGNNDGMAFGVPDPTPITTPTTSTEVPARFVASGRGVTCVVAMADDSVQCFGWIGPLVTGGVMDMTCVLGACSLAPTSYPAPPGETIAGIAVTQGDPAAAVCVWTASQRAYCLGSSALALSSTTFTAVPGLTNVAEIVSGSTAMCARTTTGEVWCWGSDDAGQLGRGMSGAIIGDPTPQQVLWP